MRFFVDVVIAALAIYVAYRTFKAWRQLAVWRISMYSMGMALLAFALVIEAFLDIYLSTFFNYEPMRYIKRLESTLRVITQMLYLAALIPLAVAVTPSRLYSITLVLLPINIALSIYIAVVTLVKLVEKKIPPFISLAFLFLAFSMVTPLFSILDLLFRLLTALFLAMGVVYAEKKEK
ncbi:MAG: hypothetical protein QXT46_06125 [Pyrobaculum sp.]